MSILQAFKELNKLRKPLEEIKGKIEEIEMAILKQNSLRLKVNGKDEINVEVEDGVEFTGVVTKVETFGETFRIEGRVEK